MEISEDQSFTSTPPKSWAEKKRFIEGDDRFPDHTLLIGWVPGYREHVFVRMVTQNCRPEANEVSESGFNRLSPPEFAEIVGLIGTGKIKPGTPIPEPPLRE